MTREKASFGPAHARRWLKVVRASHTAVVSRVARMYELKIPSVWRWPVARSGVGLALRFVVGQTVRARTGSVWVRLIWHPGGSSYGGGVVARLSSGVQSLLVGVGGSGGGKYPSCCFGTSCLIPVGVSPVVIGGSGGGKYPLCCFETSRLLSPPVVVGGSGGGK